MNLPQLIVFDLDFTVWDCDGTYCDCLTPPFRAYRGVVADSVGRRVQLYPDVLSILSYCERLGVPTAVASRTGEPAWARRLLDLLNIRHRFAYSEIYPTSKARHFVALRQGSGIPYQKMLFFDDEMRNIRDVSELGVTAVHVPNGLTSQLFHSSMPQR